MSDMTINNPTGAHGGFFGGDNHGSIVVNPSPHEPEPQPFSVRKQRLFPIGERALNLSAALLTVGAALGGWKEIEQLIHTFPLATAAQASTTSSTATASTLPEVAPILVFGACALMLALVLALRHRVRTRTMGFSGSSLLPVLAGVTDHQGRGRLALLRLQGRCQHDISGRTCGGKLRFYNKPVNWVDHYDANGATKRKVTKREAAAECRRNPDHWYKIDVTDVE